ncbi:MAG: hypothetical protein M9945_12670 [Aquamicrobium sp.]|uniref:hypothetical protein n=1 Tax=Aquamicrobium sp. TaxID=1872579 RepID=UPI00349EB978|nr:hypothetical protein [Aquamicrobium sp.]
MEHMTELPRLAEANGVFFLTLSNDRATVAYTIQRLIDMLDAMEPDPDLEDSADSWFDEDFEETGDDEPALAAAERHPGVGWGFGHETGAARREHSQEDWACGDSSGEDREDDDERELVSEDEGAVSGDEEYSLGWQDEGSQETLNMWGEYEAGLGTTEDLDQVRRIEVSEGWKCSDGEPDLGFVGHGTGWRAGEETDDREDENEHGRSDSVDGGATEHGICDSDAMHTYEEGFFAEWPGDGSGHRIADHLLAAHTISAAKTVIRQEGYEPVVLIPELRTVH